MFKIESLWLMGVSRNVLVVTPQSSNDGALCDVMASVRHALRGIAAVAPVGASAGTFDISPGILSATPTHCCIRARPLLLGLAQAGDDGWPGFRPSLTKSLFRVCKIRSRQFLAVTKPMANLRSDVIFWALGANRAGVGSVPVRFRETSLGRL